MREINNLPIKIAERTIERSDVVIFLCQKCLLTWAENVIA
jgi:hypothetical protein